MKVSIVVPAFNEEKMIARSLAAITESCAAFAALNWAWELIVCDNNSSDRTAELARAAGARVVFEPINQISRARNMGGFAAEGDWIVFVDADSFPTRSLFAEAARNMQNPRCAGGGCLVRLDERQMAADVLVTLWNTVSRIFHFPAGSFIYCDAALFRQIGGFSDKLFASEEIEFGQRLKKAARTAHRRLYIITGERLVTSARKLHLYKKGEHLRFFTRAIFFPKRFVSSREECMAWYDGRR
jgi:glycosyltransferase involved in cell wall biosynthesis